MKTVVLYHKADFDGIFCREIAKKFLPGAELIGWDYGDPTPAKEILDGTESLYMLDISIPDLMDHPKLTWIDHHKSAIDRYGPGGPEYSWKGDRHAYCIDGVAACRLAWQWFDWYSKYSDVMTPPPKEKFVNREVLEPLAVRLAGEYDIWDKRDPAAELFQHGLRSQELTDNLWDLLLVNRHVTEFQEDVGSIAVKALLERGEALQYAQTQQNASIIKELGFTFQWEGLTFLACNHARYNSLLFTAGVKPEHDALFGFKFIGHVAGGKPHEEWSISLYHAPGKEHHDLSKIAVKYGGGGHRGACGFRTTKLPFL